MLPSSAASAAVLSVVCAGPLVEALGEGVGLLAREGKLSSSRVGGALQKKKGFVYIDEVSEVVPYMITVVSYTQPEMMASSCRAFSSFALHVILKFATSSL